MKVDLFFILDPVSNYILESSLQKWMNSYFAAHLTKNERILSMTKEMNIASMMFV